MTIDKFYALMGTFGFGVAWVLLVALYPGQHSWVYVVLAAYHFLAGRSDYRSDLRRLQSGQGGWVRVRAIAVSAVIVATLYRLIVK